MKKQKTAPDWCNDWWWPILQEEKSGIKQNCVQRRKKKGGVGKEEGRRWNSRHYLLMGMVKEAKWFNLRI